MKISYDYEELIEELNADIEEGLIDKDGEVYILRSENPVMLDYHPIVDYYYLSDNEGYDPYEDYIREEYSDEEWDAICNEYKEINERFKKDFPKLRIVKVSDVLTEMTEKNRIL